MQKIISTSDNRKSARKSTLYLVRVALMAALLTSLKFALSYIPNVEVVTLLIIVYGSTFGVAYVLPATLVFCGVEVAMYGVQTWVALYFLYWPLLGVLSALLFKNREKKNPIVMAVFAVFMTGVFDVLSVSVDVCFAAINGVDVAQLGRLWVAWYVRGAYFYIAHLVSNAAIVGAAYLPLQKVAKKVLKNAFQP